MVRELARQYDEALTRCDVIVMPTLTHVSSRFTENKLTEAKTQEGMFLRKARRRSLWRYASVISI